MKIPVMILSGFLGSGKTTLLLTLLKESKARGLNPGVVMNELGKRDVDGYILQEHTGTTVEKLLDGCVCCSRKEDLPRSLNALMARRPDIIFVELTGVADPEEIAKSLQAPPLSERLMLHYTVTVLDAENVLEYNSRFSADKQLIRTLRKQLSGADLLIVNKSDLVEPETLWKIEKTVRKYNADSEIVFTHYSEINLAPLLAGITPLAPRSAAAQRSSRSIHGVPLTRMNSGHSRGATAVQEPETKEEASYSQVTAVTLTFPQAGGQSISRGELEAFFQEWGSSLVRAKGHVRLSGQEQEHQPVQLVQFAGNRVTWETSRYPGLPYIVFIGLNLNEKRLAEGWNALFA
ncbi:CobW family GTP-binding protein [Paenibacillus tianjinensis]|uniref:GTP-binding protein n=1 Tax=Paenibacillus tianjinensis TaxID=2810347 RepID=A0ABX7LFK0_9BACL|nr:GTP-binding protein [Paenibacillus tianjinensis]QSF46761.1 GTP-binding protein [Paenibacillus tianjinensis]